LVVGGSVLVTGGVDSVVLGGVEVGTVEAGDVVIDVAGDAAVVDAGAALQASGKRHNVIRKNAKAR
jgi:hypothetical protein